MGPATAWRQAAHRDGAGVPDGHVLQQPQLHRQELRGGNRVEVFDPPHAIAWLPGQGPDDANLEFGGWFWRYDLQPVGQSKTEVTLTYDWSAVPQDIREHIS